jgi:hypothetical protein
MSAKLKEQLAFVVEEAKANDPKELRKRIAELEAAARKVPAPAPIDKPAEKKAAADRVTTAILTRAGDAN